MERLDAVGVNRQRAERSSAIVCGIMDEEDNTLTESAKEMYFAYIIIVF